LAYFPQTKRVKSTFWGSAYSPGVTVVVVVELHRRLISIFPRDSGRSKGVPSGSGVFLRLLVGELWTPKLAQIFANFFTKNMSISMQNATTRRVRSGPKMSENA